MNKTILVLDDERMITATLSALIKMSLKLNVLAYNDPLHALECNELAKRRIDLIISDFIMPGMNGLDFLKKVREKSPDTVTILLTGYADKENAIRSINEVGLYYYLEKPWNNSDLIKVVQNGLEKKELSDTLSKTCEELQESNREIRRLYELLKLDYQQEIDNVKELIISLANVIEAKDQYTDGHTRRVGSISKLLGEKLGLSRERLQHLEIAGIIHDIGKVAIPEAILNKPDKLTAEEFAIIKKHPVTGETICRPLNSLQPCLDPIRHHHEKLDGSGYPDGLKADNLSLEARIIAVADIFDALYSDRPYRDKLPLPQVKETMQRESAIGALDTGVVQTLLALVDQGALNHILAV